jgi:hypothetical protein
MWVRKSGQQAAAESNRVWLWFRGPIVVFVVCFAMIIMVVVRGPRQGIAQAPFPNSLSECLYAATRFGTIAAIVDCILQIVFQRRLDPLAIRAKVVICDTCHRVKHRDSENKCECGGMFDDFDNWTWTDGDEERREGDGSDIVTNDKGDDER